MPNYYIDEAGLRRLRDISSRLFNKPINTLNRQGVYTEEALQTGDAYIVLAPVHGIAPLDQNLTIGTSTSSYALDDIPGHAYCHVFRIDQVTQPGTSTGHVRAKFTPTNRRILVYNLTLNFIQANTWLIAIRDKWNKWVVGASITGGSGGTGFITVRQDNEDGSSFDTTGVHVLEFDDEFTITSPANQIAKVKTKGFNGHKTVVTNLSWNPITCELIATYETWLFKDGLMVSDGTGVGTGTGT